MKLNYKKTFILGFGFLAITLCTTLYEAFVPVFLSKYVDKAVLIGFLMTIDNYLSLFIQPLVGRLSDRTHTRFGRRMPYILIGMPLAAIFVGLIPNHWNLASLFVVMVLYNLIMSAFRSPTIALMPDITPPQHQSKANGVINFMGGLGAAIALFIGSKLYDVNTAYPFYMGAVIMLISAAVLYFKIKEQRDSLHFAAPATNRVDKNNVKSVGERLRQCLVTIKGMKNALLLLSGVFFLYASFNSVSSFFTLFAKEYLNVSESVAAGKFAFLAALMVVFALPSGYIGAKIGKKKAMLIGISVMVCVYSAICMTSDINVVGYLFIPAGAAWALVIINAYPFVVSMTTPENTGAYTGLYYLFSSLAAIVSPPLIGLMIDAMGYSILFKYSVGGFVLALICVVFVRTPAQEPKQDENT